MVCPVKYNPIEEERSSTFVELRRDMPETAMPSLIPSEAPRTACDTVTAPPSKYAYNHSSDPANFQKRGVPFFPGIVTVYVTNHRYYTPELGRWLSKDPIEEKGGNNLYAMVGNNPIIYFDNIGLNTPPISPPSDNELKEFKDAVCRYCKACKKKETPEDLDCTAICQHLYGHQSELMAKCFLKCGKCELGKGVL